MINSNFKEQIQKAIFRKIGYLSNKNAFLGEIRIGFDNIDKDTFYDAAIELVNEGMLLNRGQGYVAFTPEGLDKADALMNPSPVVNQNTLNIGKATNSLIQHGINSEQIQHTTYYSPPNDELRRLVDLMTEHLEDLKLSSVDERKAKAQLTTIDAQLLDEPNSTIVKEAGRTLKNITEGAIGSLLATASQPVVWNTIQSLLSFF